LSISEPTITKKDAAFSFTTRFNILSSGAASILTGFRADYIAPDGCYCLNSKADIFIGEKRLMTAGNFLTFTEPTSIARDGVVQIAYARSVRPPLPVQVPADCDNGSIRVQYAFICDKKEYEEECYFQFEVGGNLVPILSPPEPPILSNSMLKMMLDEHRISEEEYHRASSVGPVDRYHIVRFPEFDKQAHFIPAGVTLTVTPEFRKFLTELSRKQFDDE
jgi:hypothetical protein